MSVPSRFAHRFLVGGVLLSLLLSGCQMQMRALADAAPPQEPAALVPDTGAAAPQGAPIQGAREEIVLNPSPVPPTPAAQSTATLAQSSRSATLAGTAAPTETAASQPTASPEPTAKPLPTAVVRLPAARWKEWPVLPQVPEGMRELYQRGLAQGNDPRAFSILGDCQSQPDEFMGVYDRDPAIIGALPTALQDTVTNFSGSFYRYSPTVKDGTTEGALLWVQWNDNKEKKCKFGETPLACELRVHKPSIVFIHVGTHWETRNRQYLEKVVDILLEHGAVPIVATKADNREKDERINQNLASLAEARGLPLWNFWAMVQHLPEGGLRHGSDTYLSKEAIPIHRHGALQALDIVWRAVR